MATTDYPVNHPLAVKHWTAEVMKEALKRTYAFRFMGTSSNSLCQVRNELKSEGDRVRVQLRLQLSGDGVLGDSTLEGNEEALSVYYDDVYVNQLRHAVRSGGKMSEQRVPFSVREEAKDGLADWWADRWDTWFFNQIAGNTAQTDVRYTGLQAAIAPSSGNVVSIDSTSTASMTSSEVLDITKIHYAVYKAKEATYPIRPIRVGGKDYYVMFISEEQATDLKTNYSAGQWGDIQKAALMGGKIADNPIFTGALGVIDNVILHSTSRLPSPATNVKRAVLCGAQACAVAFGKGYSAGNKFSWVEELFDYENQLGVAAGCISGLKKLQFNGTDLATIVVPTYAAAK